jgi:hypothetical protein
MLTAEHATGCMISMLAAHGCVSVQGHLRHLHCHAQQLTLCSSCGPSLNYQYTQQHQKLTACFCLGYELLQVCRHYNQSDLARLRHQLMVLPGEVDLLLTCEWPTGVLQQLPAGQDNLPGELICWYLHAVVPLSQRSYMQ